MEKTIKIEPFIRQIQQTFLFRGFEEAEILAMLRQENLTLEKVMPNSVLFSPHQFERRLGILLSGTLEVTKPAGNANVLISMLQPGAMFGAASIFSTAPTYATVVTAKGKCLILFFPEDVLRRMLQEHFQLTENFLYYLTQRIHFLTSRLESIASPSAEDKVLNYLASNSLDGVVVLPHGMTALSTALSISRATLYRALQKLEESNKIRRDGKSIMLLS